MSVSSGFFNSVNHDRLYDAEQFSSIFDGVITDGVYQNYGDAMKVTPVDGQNSCVAVGVGRAWFDHTWTFNDAPLVVVMDQPNEMITRVDAIVIDVDRRKDVRKNTIIYVKGDSSTPGEPPTLLKEELHRQYPICYIDRTPGPDSPVKQSEIRNLVGTDDCPAVTTVLETLNLSNLWLQLDAEFNEWWDGIRDLIGGDDPVLNLQSQIDALKEEIKNLPIGTLERPILEMFKTGDFGLKVTSYKVQGGILNQEYYQGWKTSSGGEQRNYIPSELGPSSLLPNGEYISLTWASDHQTADARFLFVNLNRYDINGVLTTTKVPNCTPHGHTNNGCNVFFDAEQYPIKAALMFTDSTKISSTYNNNLYMDVYFFTISSDDVVSFSKSIEHHDTYEVRYGPYYGGPYLFSKTSSGNSIVWSSVHSTSDYAVPTFTHIARVSSDGVGSSVQKITGGPISPYSDFAILDDAVQGQSLVNTFSYGLTGKAAVYYTDTYWSIIDETTFSVENHLGDGSRYSDTGYEIPNWNTTKYPVQTYSLSEENGVMISKKEVGVDIQTPAISEKINDYFIGATNANSGMPEGAFLAISDEGRLYGVGPGGEYIAIGTDGGAAVLKKKGSGVPSINFNKIQSMRRGYVNLNDKAYYILNNNDYYTTPNTQFTCVKVERTP